MVAKPSKIKLPVDKLLIGLMVDIELSWTKHPFLFSKFKIQSNSEIAIIKKLGLTEVTVFPDQSDIQAGDSVERPAEVSEGESEELTEVQWESKNTKLEAAEKYRTKRRAVDKKYKDQAMAVRNLTKDLKSSPANAIRDAIDLVDSMTGDFDNQNEVLTNLVNLGSGQHTLYNHSINVMVLSMSLANASEVKGNDFKLLARGALLHDVGKIEIPGQVINKKTALNRSEIEVFKQHAKLGRRLCELVDDPREEMLEVIELHHEYLDGSGYPNKYKEDKIPLFARIVAVANTYDNLCNPPNASRAMTPKIALATMYSKFKDKLDHSLVQKFISIMGIYPPGSVVSLNDESLGVVVSVDPKAMMTPEVLVYNPDIPPNKALILNLTEHPDLKIVRVLKPNQCPKRVFNYLGIQERLGYMTSSRI